MMVEFRITEDNHTKAMQLHQRRIALRWRSIMIRATGLIVLILLILAAWRGDDTQLILLAVLLVLLVVWLVISMYIQVYIVVPYMARRTYRRYKAIQEPMTVELSDDGLRFRSVNGESILRWPVIFQWRQNDQFVLVYTMPRLFHVVPKSLAQQGFDIAVLVQRLAERVGPER